jgi:hypothetical protein
MKKVFIALLSVILLSGCGLFDRGNYEKNRSGFVIKDNLIINYHTNSIGEIDVFMVDQLMSFFEAIEYTSFDASLLDDHETISSFVSTTELLDCGITSDYAIPRFLRIGYTTYFYNIRDNGYCTYDQYEFNEEGYDNGTVTIPTVDLSPVEPLNIVRFKNTDFRINTFEEMLFIETIYFDDDNNEWIKEIVTALPMSLTQAGDNYEDVGEILDEIKVIENYVLANQSINLLKLKENYKDEDINNIWADETIDYLGRDHELIKKVRLKNTGEILDIITDTLTRLGMFQ